MIEELSVGLWPFALALMLGLLLNISSAGPYGAMDVPTVKYSRFLPVFANRLIYYAIGGKLIAQGYEKVCLEKANKLLHLLPQLKLTLE